MKIIPPAARIFFTLALFVSLFAASVAQTKLNAKGFRFANDGIFAKLLTGDFLARQAPAASQGDASALDKIIFGYRGYLFEPEASGFLLRRSGLNAAFVVPTTYVVNSTGDEPDALPGDDVCLTNALTCTLRAAIQESNATAADDDTIEFNIGPGNPIIAPASSLPSISDKVTINGNTGGAIRVQIIGTNASSPNVNGLTLASGSDGSVIRSLVIRNFSGNGIRILSNSNTVQDNYIGTDATGNAAQGNSIGIAITNTTIGANIIGGTASGTRNVISGNTDDGVAISFSGNNTVQGNYIGIGADGATDVGNAGNGVSIGGGANNRIGGSTATTGAGAGNVISGNGAGGNTFADGVEINGQNGSSSTGNSVQGNIIGLNAAGSTSAVRNEGNGVLIIGADATGNTVGGSASNLRNIIASNNAAGVLNGVAINGASSNTIAGNYIGTDGATDFGFSGDGVNISGGAQNNAIGGAASTPGDAPGNIISGNNSDGIEISGSSSTGNIVRGNLIGLQAGGAAALRNDSNGVFINGAASNTVGGTTSTARNVIVGGTASTSDSVDLQTGGERRKHNRGQLHRHGHQWRG